MRHPHQFAPFSPICAILAYAPFSPMRHSHQFAIRPGQVVGVELANSRLDYGREALFRMQEEMGIDMTPVEFIAKDLAKCDFAEFSHIFVSSVCFQDNLLRTVAKKCSEGENFRILMSLKELPLQPFLAKVSSNTASSSASTSPFPHIPLLS
jgi:hypothetical protein